MCLIMHCCRHCPLNGKRSQGQNFAPGAVRQADSFALALVSVCTALARTPLAAGNDRSTATTTIESCDDLTNHINVMTLRIISM